MANSQICSIEGCDKPLVSWGLCPMHYQRWKRHGDPQVVGIKVPPRGEIRSFFLNDVLTYDGVDCLIWPYTRTPAGYGQMWFEGRLWIVSRLVCEMSQGAPPAPGYDAAHSCGNGHSGCVTRHHLSWKTRAENIADMVGHGTARRGVKNTLAILSEDDVREIRRLRGQVSQAALGERFGVHANTIGKIQLGRRWAWLDQ